MTSTKGWLVLALAMAGSSGCSGPSGPAEEKTPRSDGRIVYVVDTSTCDDCHLTSIDPDGSDPLEYPDLSIGRWSPDGTRIAAIVVREDGRIGTDLAHADGSKVTLLEISSPTLNVACFAWSPAGTTLMCEGWDDLRQNRPPGLFSIDVATNHVTRVTANHVGGHDIPADYSPDGTQILFGREDPRRKQGSEAFFVANANGTGATRITPWLSGGAASWSPDGSSIVFAQDGQLRTVAPDGSGLKSIPIDFGDGFAEAYQPGWSPDGARIVFSLFLERSGQVDLFTVAADGTDLVQLTDSPEPDEFADWGPTPPVAA
jgi:Tol biopolymer transport system component